MPTPIRTLTAAVALALVAVTAGALPADAQAVPSTQALRPQAPLAAHVVLIGFDGFDPDYLGRAPTPNIDALAAAGALGTTTGPAQSVTNPSFATLATGAWPDVSGNVAYIYDRATGTYRGQSRALAVPTIAEAVRDQGGTVGSAQYFILQNHGTAYGDPEGLYTQPGGACDRRFDDAIAMLEQRPVDSGGTTVTVPRIPQLLAVYCDTLDTLGHWLGAESPVLTDALVDLDAQVGRLREALEQVGIADRTAIVLTGDHGMTSFTQTFGGQLIDQLAVRGLRGQYLTSGQTVAPETQVVLTSAGGAVNAYLVGELQGDRRALRVVRDAAQATQGTADILDRRDQRRLHMDPRVGELVIEAQPGWADMGGFVAGPPDGRHGSTGESEATFVISGSGVRARPAGARTAIDHIDVAPTIAHLLGITPPAGAEGRIPRNLVAR